MSEERKCIETDLEYLKRKYTIRSDIKMVDLKKIKIIYFAKLNKNSKLHIPWAFVSECNLWGSNKKFKVVLELIAD